jgi:uncharacterized protein YggE
MKISAMMVLGIIVLVLVTAGLGYVYGKSTSPPAGNESIPTITVDGEATKTLSPDLLVISFSAEGFGNTSALAQSNVSAVVSSLKTTLLANGIKESEIETSSYYTYPVYNYSKNCRQPYYYDEVAYSDTAYPEETDAGYAIAPYPYPDCSGEIIGYNAVHMVTVKTGKINDGGKITDAVVSDNVDLSYVYFTLKESSRISAESDLEAEAANAAKKKAEGIAKGLGVRVGKLISVQTDDYRYPWDYPMPMYAEAGAADTSSSTTTELFPTSLELRNSITVVYELEQ